MDQNAASTEQGKQVDPSGDPDLDGTDLGASNPGTDPAATAYLPRIKAPVRPDRTNPDRTSPDRTNPDRTGPDRSSFGRPAPTTVLDPEDPWAWTTMEEPAEVIDISDCRVTAVLVTQNAAGWLSETLTALAGLTRRPTRVIAIDNESTDETLDLLDDAVTRREIDAVYLGQHGFGYGDAIRSALAQDKDAAPHRTGQGENDWLWLLHDDAAAAPDALAQLLGHVVSDPTIDITGPKLLRPRRRHRPYQISEIGVSIARSGRRHLGLDSGEIDQGQRDTPVRRLAVSSCGMLVRRTLWDTLGGFDPAVPGFRDGTEFGWRAQLAGFKVMTTPAATMVHRQVSRAGLRPSGFARNHPERIDRELGMTLIAAHASAPALPLVWLRLLLGSLLRAIGYLVGKVPGRSAAELAAGWSFFWHPRRIARMRRRLRRLETTGRGHATVGKLRPGAFAGFKAAVDWLTAAIGTRYVAIAGTEPGAAASLDELTSDEMPVAPEEKKSNPWVSPIVITLVLSLVACVVAARQLIGLGSLHSPYLLPVADNISELWRSFTAPITGAPGAVSAPWTGLVALASTIFFGQPEWLLTVLLIGTVPLALLSVYPLARHTISSRGIRLWVAVGYALLPVLLGGTNQGRLFLTVAAIVLPMLVVAGRALVLRRPGYPEAWRGGWGAAVALTVLGAFQPSVILLALLFAVVGAVTVVRHPRKIGRMVIAVGVPLIILSPWWPTVIGQLGRLFTGPDPALEGTAVAASGWELLLGRDGGAGLPPLWLGAIVFGAFWAVGLAGLFRSFRRRAVIAGWLVGLVCLAVAVLFSRLLVAVPTLATETRPNVGFYLLLGFGALILAGGIGVDGFTKDLGAQSFSIAQPLSVLAGLVAALVCLLGAGWWVLAGATGPISRTDLGAIPPYIADAQAGPSKIRTLAIDMSGGSADFSVIEEDQVRLGDAERGFAFGGSQQFSDEVADVVARLVSGSGDTQLAADLADLGINYVWIGGSNDDVRTRITNTPGIAGASGSEEGTVWQLEQPTSKVRLVSGQQVTRLQDRPDGVVVPQSSLQRVLRLGEPVDSRWVATLDGRPLTPLDDGNWQQSFEMPETGGVLKYELRGNPIWVPIGQGIALLITIVLAAPAVRRPEVRDPVRNARRVAGAGDTTRAGGGGGGLEGLSEITSTSGLLTVSNGLTTSTGKRSLLDATQVRQLRGDAVEKPDQDQDRGGDHG